ncbi:3-oxoacyl-ACP reductase [Streptococcus pneumoniae]|nr:3-oxoacyl-ACP reductase [Streptococcus pneumoniae]
MTAILSDKIKEATLAQIPMKEFGQIAIDGGLSM